MSEYDPLEVLFEGLRTDERLIQAEAARLLGELRSPKAVGPLLDYVKYARWHAKCAGFHALARIGDRSICDEIRPLVHLPNASDDWYWYGCRGVRAACAVALLALGDEGGVPYLEELADRDDDVFYAWFGPAILRLPDEPPAAKRLKGRITMDALFGPGARRTRQVEPGIVTMIAEALGVLGGPEACAKLVELMGFRSRYTRGQAAVSLLQASQADEHAAAVEQLADGDPTDFARVKACMALARAGRRECADRIVETMGGIDDPFDLAVGVEALGLIGRPEDFDPVAALLRHEDYYVRQCAVEAVDCIGCDEASAALEQCKSDSSVRVRMQVAAFFAAREGGDE